MTGKIELMLFQHKPNYIYASIISSEAMSRAYNIFGDIEGRLTMLRVECTRCARNGHAPSSLHSTDVTGI